MKSALSCYICIRNTADNMIHRLFFLTISALTCTNLVASDLDSLFQGWRKLSGHGRISAGNEILAEGLKQDLLTEERSFGRGQSIASDANVFDLMTYYYMCQDKYDEALATGLTALPLCEKAKDNELLADCLNNLGIIYQRKGLFGQAIFYMEQVYKMDLQSKDQSGLSTTMNNLATLYLAIGQASTALGYILPAIDMERTGGDRTKLAIRLGLASDIWLKMGHPEKALSCSEEAYALDKADGREDKAAIRLSQKSAVLMETGQTDDAKRCLFQAIEVLTRYDRNTSLAICHNQLGDIYNKEGQFLNACDSYKKAIEYADLAGLGYVKRKSLDGLWHSQKSLGRLDDALTTLERYSELSDRISEDRANSAVEDFRVRYETKEAEDALERQEDISKRRLITMLCLIGFIVLLAAALAFFWRMLMIRRRQASILSKNSEIKSKLLSIVPAIANKNESVKLKEIVNDIETMEDIPKMTSREQDVIKLCCEGLSSKEIADKLNVSVRTIDSHKSNIFKKLNISSTVELVRFASKAGMYTPKI